MNNILVCPKCGHYDKIEKVSSIVKSQTRTREKSEWTTHTYTDKKGKEQSFSYPLSYDVVEITDLAKRLSPPQKPQIQRYADGCTLVAVLILNGLCVILGFFLLRLISTDTSSPSAALFLYPAVLIGLGAIGLILYIARYQKSLAEDERRLEQLNKIEIPRWSSAMYRWDQLYYCTRDDIVFIPSSKWVSSSQMNDLLYETEVDSQQAPIGGDNPPTKLSVHNIKSSTSKVTNGVVKVFITFDIKNEGQAGKTCPQIEFPVVFVSKRKYEPTPYLANIKQVDIPPLSTMTFKYEADFNFMDFPIVDDISKIKIKLKPCP